MAFYKQGHLLVKRNLLDEGCLPQNAYFREAFIGAYILNMVYSPEPCNNVFCWMMNLSVIEIEPTTD